MCVCNVLGSIRFTKYEYHVLLKRVSWLGRELINTIRYSKGILKKSYVWSLSQILGNDSVEDFLARPFGYIAGKKK